MTPRNRTHVTVIDRKSKSTSALILWVSPIMALAGVLVGAWLTYRVSMVKEEREQIVARIKATPDVVTHMESMPMPLLVVANRGPVAASSLIASVEQFLFATNRQWESVAARLSSKTINRPWQFLTNSLPAGQAAEIPLPHVEISTHSNAPSAYRVEVQFYPEFNFNCKSKRTITNYFADFGGVLVPTNAPEFIRLIESTRR